MAPLASQPVEESDMVKLALFERVVVFVPFKIVKFPDVSISVYVVSRAEAVIVPWIVVFAPSVIEPVVDFVIPVAPPNLNEPSLFQ